MKIRSFSSLLLAAALLCAQPIHSIKTRAQREQEARTHCLEDHRLLTEEWNSIELAYHMKELADIVGLKFLNHCSAAATRDLCERMLFSVRKNIQSFQTDCRRAIKELSQAMAEPPVSGDAAAQLAADLKQQTATLRHTFFENLETTLATLAARCNNDIRACQDNKRPFTKIAKALHTDLFAAFQTALIAARATSKQRKHPEEPRCELLKVTITKIKERGNFWGNFIHFINDMADQDFRDKELRKACKFHKKLYAE